MKNFLSIFFSLFLLSLISCKVYKPQYVFKDITKDSLISISPNNVDLKIKSKDILAISVSSLNALEDELYNLAGGVKETFAGFEVNKEGKINYHNLGQIKVEGLTRYELKLKLEKELTPYLKDPIVSVNFTNHKITIMGDAGASVIDLPQEKINFFEAISKSTSLKDAEISKIMIIRDSTSTQKSINFLNLRNASIFSSPFFYLQPNDLVVVRPDEEKIIREQKKANFTVAFTYLLTGLNLFLVVLNNILR